MRTPVTEFSFDEPSSFMYQLECANHPESKYLWKGPGRSLHFISLIARECLCSITNLVVVDEYTIPRHCEVGTWLLRNAESEEYAHQFQL